MTEYLNISICTEDDFAPRGKKPITLRDIGVERILNRRVLTWSIKGSYGTGGAGFFAIQMEANQHYPEEWLILALWGSCTWLLLDGKEVGKLVTPPRIPCVRLINFFNRFSRLPMQLIWKLSAVVTKFRTFYDEAERTLSGARIIKAVIEEGTSVLTLQKGNINHILEIPQDGPTLPSGEKWVIKGHHLDAWLISKSGTIYC